MKVWDRKAFKANAKALFKANYWKCVLVSLILAVISSGSGGGSSFNNSSNSSGNSDFASSISDAIGSIPAEVWAIVGTVIAVAMILGIALGIFVFNPLKVGCHRFFVVNHYEPAKLNELGFAFSHNYKNNVLTMFMTNLYLFLWSLLFVIPGIVKAYSYRMVPYILSENPEMKWDDAITLSRKMMDGHKWETFVLDLSFIGWVLLSLLTLGILSIFYVSPYKNATNAEVYHFLKEDDSAEVVPEVVY